MLNIARCYLKDRLAFILGYIVNSLLLVLFFNLILRSRGESHLEIAYPLLISGFILIAILTVQWLHFYPYQKQLLEMDTKPEFKTTVKTVEQSLHYNVLARQYQHYMNQLMEQQKNDRFFRRFLSQWVHHLKTPVSVIDLILQKYQDTANLGESETMDKWTQLISDIGQENSRILDGLDQVLSFIRLEKFAEDYSPAKTDLLEDLNQVIHQRKNQFILHHVFPKVICDFQKVYVLTDSKWNRILLEQLLSNAIKYSAVENDAKNVFINIRDDGRHIWLTIADQGMGIPPYDLPRVFDPFFTGENGRKVKSSSGIGLYLCKQISQQLGQTLELESDLVSGTKATIGYLKA
jgi:signal transduction histidine kinase